MLNRLGIRGLGAVFTTLAAAACAHPSEEELGLIEAKLAIRPGVVVADVGSGEGDVTVALGELVGEGGRVIATEIDPDKRVATTERAKASGRANITVVEATEDDTGLGPGCCDAIFLRGVYHHLTKPAETLAEFHDALRPGGRLLIVDFVPSTLLAPWTPEGLPENRSGHGIDSSLVIEEVTAVGLVHVETIEAWPGPWPLDFYGLVFRRLRSDETP